MQQGRGRGGKYSEETCGQERRVEGNDKAVIRLDAVHELRTQRTEFGEVAQVATGKRSCSPSWVSVPHSLPITRSPRRLFT